MSLLDLLIALAGGFVTVMVVIGMILLVPSGAVPVHREGAQLDGPSFSPAPEPAPGAAPASASG